MIALGVLASGVLLLVAGLVAWFGAPAAVGAGVVLVAAGLVVDWEKVSRGKHPLPPPWRQR